jgi:hypothetical protein
MKIKFFFLAAYLIMTGISAFAQDALMNELNGLEVKTKEHTTATFKGTRLINLQTIETLKKGALDFRISHRFGDIGSGAQNLWGLDGPATLRLGLDYSLTDRLVVGVGRTSYQKYFDGFLKYKVIQQASHGPAFSLVAIASGNIITDTDPNKAVTGVDRYQYFSSRVAYMTQVLIARKFNQKLSLQLAPTWIHYNMVTRANDKNDVVALGISGRYKITRSLALTGEYISRISKYAPDQNSFHNVLSVGLDIETGGHVFQLFFTNASAINEVQFIPYTSSSWSNQAFRFGFNISRVFQLSKKNRTEAGYK